MSAHDNLSPDQFAWHDEVKSWANDNPEGVRDMHVHPASIPGGHGAYAHRERLNEDVKTNGVKSPLMVTVDRNGMRLSDGNHRRHAAIQAGMDSVPITVFGHMAYDAKDAKIDADTHAGIKDWR